MSNEKLPDSGVKRPFVFMHVFGRPFGAFSKTVFPTGSEAADFRIKFRTPSNLIEGFWFKVGHSSFLATAMDGTIILRLLDEAGNVLVENEDYVEGFVNMVDEWPREGTVIPGGFSPGNSGGGVMQRPEMTQWLRPNRLYFLEVERKEGHFEKSFPIPIAFHCWGAGTEFPEDDESPAPEPPMPSPDIGEVPITIDGIDGIWKPVD